MAKPKPYIPPHIRREYESTKTSYKRLSDKYDITEGALKMCGKDNGWVKFNPDMVIDTTTKEATQLSEVVVLREDEIITNIKAVLGSYYRPIDDVLIFAYVDSYLTCLELKSSIATQGRVMVSEKTNGHYINPSVNLLQAEKNNLIKLGKELGINTASRIRLGMDVEKHNENKTESIFDIMKNIMEDTVIES